MKVSVSITAYNHERFIAQTLESVLAQQTTFDFEVVVGEDCSTDGTRRVLADFASRYPGRVRLLLQERNQGMNRNFIQTIESCRGQYVALLDGDDYWTRPDKLQRMADFLDEHADCAIAFHNVKAVHEDGNAEATEYCGAEQKPFSTLEDLLVRNFMPTCGVMFRRGLSGPIPDWFYDLAMGDWPLHVLNACHGRIGYVNEIMGVYRFHRGGAWSMREATFRKRSVVAFYEAIRRHLGPAYHRRISALLAFHRYELARLLESDGAYRDARRCVLRSVWDCPLRADMPVGQVLRIAMRDYLPHFYSAARLGRRAVHGLLTWGAW